MAASDARRDEPDTITIIEHHVQEMDGCGADMLCSIETEWPKGGLPPRVADIRQSLAAAGLKPECLSLGETSSTHEHFGRVVVLAATASVLIIVAGVNSPVPFSLLVLILAAGNALVLSAAWFLTQSNRCQFRITAERVEDVERIQVLLRERHPQATVLATNWRYHLESDLLGDWVETAIARANKRAERAAQALGVEIVGILSYEENHELPSHYFTPVATSRWSAPESAASDDSHMRETAPFTGNASLRWGQASPTYYPTGNDDFARSRAGAHVIVRYRVAHYDPTKAKRPEPAKSSA